MEELTIQYRGFSPSQFTQNHVRTLMQKIHDESPASATLRVSLVKMREHAFKGFIRISSHAGHFFVQATSSGVIDLTHQLLERARRKLEKWKRKRFHDRRHSLFDELSQQDSFLPKDSKSFGGNYGSSQSKAN